MVKNSRKDKAKSRKSLIDKTALYLRNKGICKSVKPEQDGQMPQDPTRCGPKDLQRHLTNMVGWFSYTNDALAETNIELIDAENELRKAKAMFRATAGSKAKWKCDNEMVVDETIKGLQRRFDVLNARKIALEAIVVNYDKKSGVLSRDLTRRGQEFGRGGRIA